MSEPARTYNQNHVPRPYASGRPRVSIYMSWSYPAEANRNPAERGAHQHAYRPPIGDHMVHRQQQNMLLLRKLHQLDPEQRTLRQIEGSISSSWICSLAMRSTLMMLTPPSESDLSNSTATVLQAASSAYQ